MFFPPFIDEQDYSGGIGPTVLQFHQRTRKTAGAALQKDAIFFRHEFDLNCIEVKIPEVFDADDEVLFQAGTFEFIKSFTPCGDMTESTVAGQRTLEFSSQDRVDEVNFTIDGAPASLTLD